MRIISVTPLVNNNFKNFSNISLKGVSLGNFDEKNQNIDDLLNIKNEDFAQKFKDGLQSIKEGAKRRR